MFHKMAQMIQMHTEKKLLDEVFATYRDVQDAAAEMAQVLPCPRCGKQTMKMRLHSNALSRQVPASRFVTAAEPKKHWKMLFTSRWMFASGH